MSSIGHSSHKELQTSACANQRHNLWRDPAKALATGLRQPTAVLGPARIVEGGGQTAPMWPKLPHTCLARFWCDPVVASAGQGRPVPRLCCPRGLPRQIRDGSQGTGNRQRTARQALRAVAEPPKLDRKSFNRAPSLSADLPADLPRDVPQKIKKEMFFTFFSVHASGWPSQGQKKTSKKLFRASFQARLRSTQKGKWVHH